MNEVVKLCQAEPRDILQAVIEGKIPAIMSYLSDGKWHVAKVLLTGLGANSLNVEIAPSQTPHSINIHIEQPVGISLKYGSGKLIFETSVLAFGPASDSTSGGAISFVVPNRVAIVQRRNYFRVKVPDTLKVMVCLWHRLQGYSAEYSQDQSRENSQEKPLHYWQGRLVDISAGGAQIIVDIAQRPDFKKGQFVGLRFTPMPYEIPLMFDAQIRSILPTADGKSICLGLQMVGLEASSEGRRILERLCNVGEVYYQINRSGAKIRDFQTTSS